MKHALRSLARSPGFTLVAVITLALGIGANTAIFSLVQSVLLRPLPYPAPERLVAIWEKQPSYAVAPMSWPSVQDYRRDNQTFTGIAGYRRTTYTLTNAGEPEVVSAAQVNASLFGVIGLEPQLGRTFTETEDQPGAPLLVVLSDSLWRSRFGAAPSVVDRSVTLNGEPFTIIGVLPPEFAMPAGADVFTQLGRVMTAQRGADGVSRSLAAVGRMKTGVTLGQALADLRRISTRIEQDDPRFSTGISAAGELLFEQAVGSYRQGLWTLLGAAALVLLVACTNLSNLLLARGSARAGEIAMRSALGATRGMLMRPLLLESALLASAGGLLGVLLAMWVHDGIVGLAPAGIPRFQEARIDGVVLAVAALVSAATVILFGLWPAWRAAQTDLRSVVAQGGRGGSAGPNATRGREMLIVAEVAITLVLLVGAGLLLKSLARARATDLGFDAQHVLTARLALPGRAYSAPQKSTALFSQLLERLGAAPGVIAAAIASTPPLVGANRSWQNSYVIDGQPAPPPGQEFMAEVNAVSDDYFRTLNIPVMQGRGFGATDTDGAERVIIVDRAFAERHWPGQNPVGQHIRWGSASGNALTVVGVVPSLRLYGYAIEALLPQAYVPGPQETGTRVTLLIRTQRDPMAFTGVLRETLNTLDPGLAIAEVATFEEKVASTFGTPRLYTFLLSIFAGLAMLLAVLGLYGVLAYQVSRRRREFGIRLALGAVAIQLISLVVRRGLRLVSLGAVLGLIGAIIFGRVLRSLLYETSPFDSVVFASVTAIFLVVAMAASWLPARRAAKTDPMIALRAE